MGCYLINAESLKAYYIGRPGGGILVIEAQGHSECVNDVRITPSLLPIEPPEFNLTTCTCPIIGMFPYSVRATFSRGYTPEVVVNTASGPKTVKVLPVPDAETVAAQAEPTGGEVTGYAPNSSNINAAFDDAISKLRQLYPSNVNAVVTQIGFFAVGSPVGIAGTFVTMKQQDS